MQGPLAQMTQTVVFSEASCSSKTFCSSELIFRNLGHCPYSDVFQAMQQFTEKRSSTTQDECWRVEHPPVYTQGLAGKAEHVLDPRDIPVVQTDRGGQVTYHGPGQLVLYLLIDLKRKNFTIRKLVSSIEQSIITLLLNYNINAHTKKQAPGVYIEDAKICALGLRIKKGCSYHGLSFNIDMDLEPFNRINPCGFKHLKITQLRDFLSPTPSIQTLTNQLIQQLSLQLNYRKHYEL